MSGSGLRPHTGAVAGTLDSAASWRTLAGCGLTFVFGVPALFGSTFGLFMVPLQQSQGWGRADIAFSLTLTTLVSWLSVLASGWLTDHLRLRPLVFVGVVLGAANLAAFSLMGASVWHFYLLVVALAFTTMGCSPIALSKIVQGWFDKRLGIALGVFFACAALGGVIHPLIITSVIGSAGWRQAFVVMGAMALVGGLLAAALLIREPPAAAPAAAGGGVKTKAKAPMLAFLSQRVWWVLALWNLLFAFGSGCILVHFAALLHDRGVAAAQIGVAASLIGASHFAGNLLAGWLVDRINPRHLAWLLMLMPLSAALLLLKGQGYVAMAIAAGVLGLASGSDGSLSAFLARHYFGNRLFGQAIATQMVATAFGGGLAPWLSGLMRDQSGNYELSLTVAAAAFAGAVVAGWLLPTRAGVQDAAVPTATPAPAAPA